MRQRAFTVGIIAMLALASVVVAGIGAQELDRPDATTDVGTAFTYHGRLTDDAGTPLTGQYDFQFRLYDGSGQDAGQIGSTVTANDRQVDDGRFTLMLDFGANAFTGDARWLEIRVREGGSDDAFTRLLPRQELTPAPYALYAEQVPWSGINGVPAGLADGDDDTTYGAGAGLSVSGSTFSVDFAGSGSAGTAARSDHEHEDGLSGLGCGDLETPVWNEAAGVWECINVVTLLGRPASTITVDSTRDVGQYAVIAIGADGLPVISYRDSTTFDLKVAHCEDAACRSATTTVVDGTLDGRASIAIGADGLPIIAYRRGENVKVAHCDDVACAVATTSVVDTVPPLIDRQASLAIGADGLPIISYLDVDSGGLKVAHCDDASCSTADLHIVDSAGDVGLYSSIAIGADDLPIISYTDGTNFDLKVAHCENVSCESATIVTLEELGGAGWSSSIAIGADGLPIISYLFGDGSLADDLRVVHCDDPACSSHTVGTISNLGTFRSSAITIGADGLPIVSYLTLRRSDPRHLLRVAHCADVTCSNAAISTVVGRDESPLSNAIAIGADGLPVISYGDGENGVLKVARCISASCRP